MAAPLTFKTTTPATINSADDVILKVDVPNGYNTLAVEVENVTGGAILTSFKIQLKDHPNGAWYDYLADADFLDLTIPNLKFVSTTSPHTLAAAGKAHIHARINGAYAIRFVANCGTSTTVHVRGCLSHQ